MPVTTKHPEYEKAYPYWKMIKDALDGVQTIKEGDYLPKPIGMKEAEKIDSSNDYIYKGYKDRAEYPLWVSDNRRSMIGLTLKLEPEIKLPKELEPLINSVTSDGFGLRQLFARVAINSLTYGRQALLLDIDQEGNPYISVYDAFSVINWQESKSSNGHNDLTLVVLTEQRRINENDPFAHDTETVYRVLSLDEYGNYKSELYANDATTIIEENTLGQYDPTTNRLIKGLNYIPLVFSGSIDNAPDVDEIPLLTMALSALKYYQLSADYFYELHQTGHPQPWISGINNNLLKDFKLAVTGATSAWILPPNANVGYLEISGRGLEEKRTAMAAQKNAALESGARVIDLGSNESGDARRARQDDQHATLGSVVKTAAEGIEQLLKYAAEAKGLNPDEVVFSVKAEFSSVGIDSTVLTNLYQAATSGIISHGTYWNYLQTGKIPEHVYDDERLKIEAPTVYDDE